MPATALSPNEWSIRRKLGGFRVECKFVAIPAAAAWGMQVIVNGVLIEHKISDSPLQDSEIAILNAASLLCDEVDTAPCPNFRFPFSANAGATQETTT